MYGYRVGIIRTNKTTNQKQSIQSIDSFRVMMAQRQLAKYEAMNISKDEMLGQVVSLVKALLSKLKMELPDDYDCIIQLNDDEPDYKLVLHGLELAARDDIVWIKTNQNGCISVVGTSRDISFSQDAEENTTAGKINSYLGQQWDDSQVLIFPLLNIPEGLKRSEVESLIGDYLISNGIPILDFYSHEY